MKSILSLFISIILFSQVNAEPQKMNLSPNNSFESDLSKIETKLCNFGGWFPIGVITTDGKSEIKIVQVPRSGKKSLQVIPNSSKVTGTIYYSSNNGGEVVRNDVDGEGVRGARTLAMRLDQDIIKVDASVWVKKAENQNVTLKAIWYTRRKQVPFIKLFEQKIDEPVEEKDGWYQYSMHLTRPNIARQVQIVIETDGTSSYYIDDVEIYFHRYHHIDVLVDQLGYETNSEAKGIVLQSSTAPAQQPDSFSIINLENFENVHTGKWKENGYFSEWDLYHWEGDFSSLKVTGRFVVETTIDNIVHQSQPFLIKDNLLVSATSELAYRFFYYQRCGISIPYYHPLCHLDDAKMPDGTTRDLVGGWHDAGIYDKHNSLTSAALYALIVAYDRRKDFFDQFDSDKNGRADILDEAEWGAKYLYKCIDQQTLEMMGGIVASLGAGRFKWGKPHTQTDNIPKSGDERPVYDAKKGHASWCISGFALLGKYLPDGQKYNDMAERAYKDQGSTGSMDQILALYRATQKIEYRDAATKQVKNILSKNQQGTASFRTLGEYAFRFPDDVLVPEIRKIAAKRLQELLVLCDNPFKFLRSVDDNGNFVFFRRPNDVNWDIGNTFILLGIAYECLLLEKLGFSRGRAIAENQVHWILGRNPFGVSTMDGVGSVFIPQYHHRYNTLPGNPRGVVPGALVNGLVRAWPDHDRPWLDLFPEPYGEWQSNEQWLPHNSNWLQVISIW